MRSSQSTVPQLIQLFKIGLQKNSVNEAIVGKIQKLIVQAKLISK